MIACWSVILVPHSAYITGLTIIWSHLIAPLPPNIAQLSELELSKAASITAQNFQVQQSAEIENLYAEIESLKAALANETVSVENERNIIVQLRADLDLSQAATVEAKNFQAQQSAEIEKLKVALANETVNMENECNLKLELSAERLAK